ncbi:MAG: hypothetical protein OSJ43_07475 [Oscillospiraceae bacterium]|nr:hypothetical protein [Oscillospiraceae bacterium]
MNCKSLYEFAGCAGELSLKKILAANDSSVTDIVIPSEYSSIPVTEIGFEAFAQAPFIKTLVIPESVPKPGGAERSASVRGWIAFTFRAVLVSCPRRCFSGVRR